MTHRERVDALVEAYQHISPEPEAEQAAEHFGHFAATRGARVRIVHAEDGEDPRHPTHVWVRVLNLEGIHGYDVDVTASRFGDTDVPSVLVWRMDGRHPVTGEHHTMRVTPAVPPAR